MEQALNELRNAMSNLSAVERYEKGYREEHKPETEMDKAIQNYKEAHAKNQKLEKCVFSA